MDKGGDRGIPVPAPLPIPLFLPPRPQGPALVRTAGRTLSATELGFPASLKAEREGKLPQSWKSFHFPELSSFSLRRSLPRFPLGRRRRLESRTPEEKSPSAALGSWAGGSRHEQK